MWLSEKKERNWLAFYYKEWAAGSSSFPCKKPMDEVTDRHLKNLGLINTESITYPKAEIRVSLTLDGIRLGQKYNGGWLVKSGVWFAEYKDHWFWLILSFLGGIIGALLVNWLSFIFTKNSGC